MKEPGHSVFIDPSKNSEFYNYISDFNFGKFDGDSYSRSLDYLKEKKITLTPNRITGIPQKWILVYYYKNNFYAYHPSDFYNHFKVSITDTAFVDVSGEGPCANKVLAWKKIDEHTFSFSLTGLEYPERQLLIHLIDLQKGIAVFEELINKKEKRFLLMVDAGKLRQLPIIVNYCDSSKQMEFDFEVPDYQEWILRGKASK